MKYSKRSFHFAWISIVIAIVFLVLSQTSRNSSTQFDAAISFLITFQYMSILIGFACAMMSLREEKTKIQRWAFAINVLLFLVLTIYFTYSYFTKTT